MANKLSAKEKQWRAEDDAYTLARYSEILSDKNRLDMAKKQATKRANELQKQASNLKKVVAKKPTKKKTTNKK